MRFSDNLYMQIQNDQLWLSPSDLSSYLACRYLSSLQLQVARGTRAKPHGRDKLADLIAEKGDEHEQAFLEQLGAEGRQIESIPLGFTPETGPDFDRAAELTVAAMRAGADVIYQATFCRDGWRGRSDFVIRVERPSDLGGWSYEAWDTKLARSAKPSAVLQLAYYSQEIAQVQGTLPGTHARGARYG